MAKGKNKELRLFLDGEEIDLSGYNLEMQRLRAAEVGHFGLPKRKSNSQIRRIGKSGPGGLFRRMGKR